MMKRAAPAAIALALTLVLPGCARLPRETAAPTVPQTTYSEPTCPTTVPTVPTVPPTTAVTTEPAAYAPEDFVRVLDLVPNARQLLYYGTEENFTGQVIYDFSDAYLRYGTACKLAEAARELEELGLGLLIWDAYRPVSAQARLFEAYPDPKYVSKPGVGNQNHCRGRAVDLTLYDLQTGEALVMPTGFDDFSDLADRDYSDADEEAAANAALLEQVLERHGFRGYRGEWWHFNDTDDYPIEEVFEPTNS